MILVRLPYYGRTLFFCLALCIRLVPSHKGGKSMKSDKMDLRRSVRIYWIEQRCYFRPFEHYSAM